jgi:hypothetical protein
MIDALAREDRMKHFGFQAQIAIDCPQEIAFAGYALSHLPGRRDGIELRIDQRQLLAQQFERERQSLRLVLNRRHDFAASALAASRPGWSKPVQHLRVIPPLQA